MPKAEYISNELKELQSKLPIDLQVPYQVPAGYFGSIASKNRATDSCAGRIKSVSPLLKQFGQDNALSNTGRVILKTFRLRVTFLKKTFRLPRK